MSEIRKRQEIGKIRREEKKRMHVRVYREKQKRKKKKYVDCG